MKAIKCGDPICCSCSCALEFASVYSRESIFQVLVAGGFSKPGIEVAVLWTSSGMATSVIWGLMQVFFPLACGVGIQRLYIYLHLERQGLPLLPVQLQQQEGILPSV